MISSGLNPSPELIDSDRILRGNPHFWAGKPRSQKLESVNQVIDTEITDGLDRILFIM